jgi:cytidyltransferase-like protein
MRGPRAERVTAVHRIFLAAQWPEVHPRPTLGASTWEQLPGAQTECFTAYSQMPFSAKLAGTNGIWRRVGEHRSSTQGLQHGLQQWPATTKLTGHYSAESGSAEAGKTGRESTMNIGLFGGSFDPIHRGHLALPEAAAERYALRQVLFVAANVPPHKQKPPLTAFIHRYAMVALATQDERRFVPSLLEAPEWTTRTTSFAQVRTQPSLAGVATSAPANYSIDTVRR